MSKKVTTAFLEEAAIRYALAHCFGILWETNGEGKSIPVRPCAVDMPPYVKLLGERLQDEAINYFRECGMAGADFPVQMGMENKEEKTP